MHSFLIANIINPNSEHGQGDLFLKSLLKKLDIEVYENDNWIVTAEIGRIDILIKRENPHTVIVIENKSNYAIDQENQIYRYWYQEIYLPNKKQLKPISEENYHIIYLHLLFYQQYGCMLYHYLMLLLLIVVLKHHRILP